MRPTPTGSLVNLGDENLTTLLPTFFVLLGLIFLRFRHLETMCVCLAAVCRYTCVPAFAVDMGIS